MALGSDTYDAIVVGTGITGGWAAKEMCEQGLKTLVLDRGRLVRHVRDYPTAGKAPWELPYGDQLTHEDRKKHAILNREGYFSSQATKHWFANELENPYVEEKRFDWVRSYHVGGRSIVWGRHCYRWSDLDFAANLKDGVAVDWPIRYVDLAPWYDHVESFIGVAGSAEGIAHLPDGNFLPPIPLNCLETHVKKRIEAEFRDRRLIHGRVANLTVAHQGRGRCQFRNACMRGCVSGSYFSSQAATLPAAAATGNMTLRPHSIVNSIIYDKDDRRATGVRVIDAQTQKWMEYRARVIFLNASTLGSAFILLNSTCDRFPTGMGNDSGELGCNLMDHHLRAGAWGTYVGLQDRYYRGMLPGALYVPRFRNVADQRSDYIRGFGYQGGADRANWRRTVPEMLIGEELKETLAEPGAWNMGLVGFGECLPYHENRVRLTDTKKDKWGQPTLSIRCEFKDNELAMRKDMQEAAVEMLEASGLDNVNGFDELSPPGMAVHEMGTARMGRDPQTSVLNGHNQIHAVPNVFVTDGACMTSSACQNPSLTYMALTARAAHYAVDQLNKRNL